MPTFPIKGNIRYQSSPHSPLVSENTFASSDVIHSETSVPSSFSIAILVLPFVERADGVDVHIHAKSVAELIGDIELQAKRHCIPKFRNSRGETR